MEYLYLFFSAFISATLFPLGSEALLLYDLSLNLNIFLIFLFATIGNSLGSIFNYYLGFKGEKYILEKDIINQKKLQKAQNSFTKYGGYSLLLAWVPIIGDPITFIAGILKYDFKKFIILIFISKGSRYLFIIYGYCIFQG